jgi:hypothetical protein
MSDHLRHNPMRDERARVNLIRQQLETYASLKAEQRELQRLYAKLTERDEMLGRWLDMSDPAQEPDRLLQTVRGGG